MKYLYRVGLSVLVFLCFIAFPSCATVTEGNSEITYETANSYFGRDAKDVCDALRKTNSIKSLHDSRDRFYSGFDYSYNSRYNYNYYKRPRLGLESGYDYYWDNRRVQNELESHVRSYLKRYSRYFYNSDYSQLKSCYDKYRRVY